MKKLGMHVLVDAWECPAQNLDDVERVERAIRAAILAGGATLIDMCTHRFSPHGVTATATLAESHITVHTWPEHGYFAADIFFCGALDPHKGIDALVSGMGAKRHEHRSIARGPRVTVEPQPVMRADTAVDPSAAAADQP